MTSRVEGSGSCRLSTTRFSDEHDCQTVDYSSAGVKYQVALLNEERTEPGPEHERPKLGPSRSLPRSNVDLPPIAYPERSDPIPKPEEMIADFVNAKAGIDTLVREASGRW